MKLTSWMGYMENDMAEERTGTCEDGSIQNIQTEAEWEKSSKNKEENKKQKYAYNECQTRVITEYK